jgi:hypothetical protein
MFVPEAQFVGNLNIKYFKKKFIKNIIGMSEKSCYGLTEMNDKNYGEYFLFIIFNTCLTSTFSIVKSFEVF